MVKSIRLSLSFTGRAPSKTRVWVQCRWKRAFLTASLESLSLENTGDRCIQGFLWVSSSTGSSLANKHSRGRPELHRELFPMEGGVLTNIPCYTLIRCCQSSTGSLLPLPPNPPLPLDWMLSALKLSWKRGAHRGERGGCPSAVHHPSSQGQIGRLLSWSNLPLILSEQALLLLISPTFLLPYPFPTSEEDWLGTNIQVNQFGQKEIPVYWPLYSPTSLTKGWGNWIAYIHFWKHCRKSKGNKTGRGGMVLQGRTEKTVQVMLEANWEFMGRSPHWLSKPNGCRNRLQMAAQGWEWWKGLRCGAVHPV